MLASHKEILHKLDKMEHKLAEHDNQILVIFEYLKQLEQVKQQELDQKAESSQQYFKNSFQLFRDSYSMIILTRYKSGS